MRLQVNKTCIDLRSDLVWQYPDGKNHHSSAIAYYHNPNLYISCRFCEHCGAEFFASWIIMEYWQKRFISDVQDADEREAYRKYMNLRKPYDEKIKSLYQEESNNFKEMEKCPICGETLLNDNGHFYSKLYFTAWDECPDFASFLGLKDTGDDDWYFCYDYNDMPQEKRNEFRDKGLDAIFLGMAEKRRELDSESSVNLVEQFVTDVDDTENHMEIAAMSAAKFDGSLDNLKEYILNLITMENNIYALTKRLPILYKQRIENDRDIRKMKGASLVERVVKLYKENENAEIKEKELPREIDKNNELLDSLNQELLDLKSKKEEGYTEAYPIEPQIPVFKKIGIFNKATAIAENDRLQLEYENALKKYERDVERYEKEKSDFGKNIVEKIDQVMARIHSVENENEEIRTTIKNLEERRKNPLEIDTSGINLLSEIPPCPEIAFKNLLDKEISIAEDLLKKTLKERRRLYNMNIIFGKYRNVVALSTFYEYLMAGRCTSLDGANGAYNIYEAECRANIIVSQLSRVIELLEEIRDTQYMICSALVSINNGLDTLNRTMSTATTSIKKIEVNTANTNDYLSNISKNSDVIAYNTAATAYYSKKTAELTNSLGYMFALS